MNASRARAALFAIAAGGLALRVWGVGFGLPELFHPDEPAYVLQALAVGRGLPNGLTFADPPLFKYILLTEYAAAFGVDRVTGSVHSAQEFVDQFRADPSRLYLLARLSSAVLGALTVIATGALGTAVRGRRVGLVAAVLCACAYLLVRESHFGVNDALVTLVVTLGLVCCVRRRVLLAGALAGLAFSAKYDGVALLAPLVLAAGFTRRLAWALAAGVLGAVLTVPSLLTEPARVVNDMYVHLYVSATGGYDGLDPSGGYIFYARALGIGLGWPLLVAAVAGIGLSVARKDRNSLVVASLPVAMLLVLGSQHLYFARFALPFIPALLVESAIALDALLTWRPAAGIVIGSLVVLPTLTDAVRFDHLLTQPDTRTLARQWVDESLPAEALIAVDAPPLGPTLNGANVVVANDSALYDRSLDDYRASGLEYLVVSSYVSEARAVDPAREQRRLSFLRALPERASLVAQFRPYTGESEPPFAYDSIYGPWTDLDRLARPGPTISVYRLTP